MANFFKRLINGDINIGLNQSITQFNTNLESGSSVTINGKTYKGKNVSIINGTVFIDGVKQEDSKIKSTTINVVVNGNTKNVEAGGAITVNGEVDGKLDAGSSIKVTGNVKGNLDAGSSIKVDGDVKGKLDAGSSITIKGDHYKQ